MENHAFSRLLMSVCFGFVLASPLNSFAQDEQSAQQWREDLHFMAAELEARHIDLFHTMTRVQFTTAVQRLHERIPSLEDHQVIVEMARITAMIGDGHSGLRLASDPRVAFRSYPIRFYYYSDGFFVQRVARKHAAVVGARLVSIGEVSAEAAYDALRELIPRDNDQYAKLYAPYFMASPEILHALGIIDEMETASFIFEKEGQQIKVDFEPEGILMLTGEVLTDSGMAHIDWIDARDEAQAPTPLWLKEPKENKFWFEYLHDERTMYVQINEMQDKEDETLAEFAERLFAFVEEHPVERFVYDLRWNRGGDNTLMYPLVIGIIKAKVLDQRGRFFTIIGRQSFSAAQSLVNELEKYTHVLFVGEPTASRVNFYADNHKIILPHSGLKVRASYVLMQYMHFLDDRRWTAPHIPVELTSEDYRNNRDPVMEAILNHEY